MARINVEESIHKDPRFFALAVKLGGREQAMGTLVYAWLLAQEWWKTNGRLVPLNEWKRLPHFDMLLEVGLAEIRDGKVYVAGATDSFRWLEQKQNAGRGNKGKSRKRTVTGVKRTPTRDEPLSPSPLPSPSPISRSLSDSFAPQSSTEDAPSELLPPEGDPPRDRKRDRGGLRGGKGPAPTTPVWDAWRESYLARYQTEPIRNQEFNVQAANLIRKLSTAEAPEVARFYLAHNAYLYVNSGHAIGLLVRDAQKLRTEWITGRKVTQAAARQADTLEANSQVYESILRKYEADVG